MKIAVIGDLHYPGNSGITKELIREVIEARFYKTFTIFYSQFTSNIWQLKKKLLSRLMPYWSGSVYNSYKILIDREVSMWECHGLERAEWYLMKPIRFATHYFYSHLPDETYIKLRKLSSHYYIYAENEPWEDDIVELAIRRFNNFYYKLDLIYQYQKDTANEMSAESLNIFLFFSPRLIGAVLALSEDFAPQ